MAPKKSTSKPMSPAHKEALAEGRAQAKAVRDYLEALASTKRPRGRPRDTQTMENRLDAVTEELKDADPMNRLHLTQEQIDLKQALQRTRRPEVDLSKLERDFIRSAAPYAERKKLSYRAFRSVGVPTEVLKKAGIKRS